MSNQAILYPVCALVFLSLIVLFSLAKARVTAIRRARVSPQAIADPVRFGQILQGTENLSDNFENLFEVPVLFYIAAILIFILQQSDLFYLALAWVFVAFRFAHTWIHCTTNRVSQRFYVFLISTLAVLLIWIRLTVQLLNR